jgi:hypothetical protein
MCHACGEEDGGKENEIKFKKKHACRADVAKKKLGVGKIKI